MLLLKACLNGSRSRADHVRCPISAGDLARDAAAAVAAGAGALHVHPRDDRGAETLDAAPVAAALDAIRRAVSAVRAFGPRRPPVGVSTGEWIVADPVARCRAIERWVVLPDFASVNVHEAGARDVARTLLDRGIGVEAGVWTAAAADELLHGDLAERCVRILFEPTAGTLAGALDTVTAIEHRLAGVAPGVPRLLHGVDATAWPLLAVAARRGLDARIGLEDTLLRRDGLPATGNADLVIEAVRQLDDR